jgi:hypothetical protein
MTAADEPKMADLIRALDEVLDVEAGLTDAELPTTHRAMTDALDDILDLGAGLAQVQPPAVPSTEPSALHRFARKFAALPPAERLAERVPLSNELNDLRSVTRLTLALDIDDQLLALRAENPAQIDAATRRLHNHVALCQHELDKLPRLFMRDAFFALLRFCAATLDEVAISRALRWLNDLRREADPWHKQAFLAATAIARPNTDLFAALRDDMATWETNLGATTAFHQSLLDAVEILEVVMTDFTATDLRDADLSNVPLGGLRWSTATRWPPEWVAEIRARSTEIEPGLFEIGPDTQILVT